MLLIFFSSWLNILNQWKLFFGFSSKTFFKIIGTLGTVYHTYYGVPVPYEPYAGSLPTVLNAEKSVSDPHVFCADPDISFWGYAGPVPVLKRQIFHGRLDPDPRNEGIRILNFDPLNNSVADPDPGVSGFKLPGRIRIRNPDPAPATEIGL